MSMNDTTDADAVVDEVLEDERVHTEELEPHEAESSDVERAVDEAAVYAAVNSDVSELPLKDILEGALLAASQPLSMERLLSLFDDEEKPERSVLQETIQALMVDYENRGFELVESATGFRFQVRARVGKWVGRLWEEKPQRYSRALLETIALIAYRQPITRGDIEDIRGVAVSSHIIKTLLEREWVRVVGHRDVPGRPAMYATTKHFLDYFNLTSLDDLPELSEIKNLDSPLEEGESADGGENRSLEDQLSVPERIEQRPESEIKSLAEDELQTAEAINSAVEHNVFHKPNDDDNVDQEANSTEVSQGDHVASSRSGSITTASSNAAVASPSSFASLLNKHGFGEQETSVTRVEAERPSEHEREGISSVTEIETEAHAATVQAESSTLSIDKNSTESKVLGSELPGTEELVNHELLSAGVAVGDIVEVKAAEAAEFLAQAEKLAADLSWDEADDRQLSTESESSSATDSTGAPSAPVTDTDK